MNLSDSHGDGSGDGDDMSLGEQSSMSNPRTDFLREEEFIKGTKTRKREIRQTKQLRGKGKKKPISYSRPIKTARILNVLYASRLHVY